MEEHEEIDFGVPGPLVHFIEQICAKDESGKDIYELLLTESIRRKAGHYTLWMLNRILNATDDPNDRRRLLAVMAAARETVSGSAELLEEIDDYLEYQKANHG
jgi:hypothetical protein